VLAMAAEEAAGPLTGQDTGLGNDVQQRGSPAEEAPTLPRPTGITRQSPGPLTLDIVYPGEQMRYTKDMRSLESLDPLENADCFRWILTHAIIVTLVWVLGSILLLALGAILFFGFHFVSIVTGSVLTVVWWIAMACVFWFRKLQCRVGAWNFLLTEKADVAPLTFNHIAWALKRRGTPVDSCRVRRFSAARRCQRDVLEVRKGIFYGMVSCFASGEDLYIGWTYWLCLSPARWLMRWLRRFLWGGRLHYHAVHAGQYSDGAEALRAALHRDVQEGLEVARGNLAAQGEGTIGTLVPVVDSKSGLRWMRL
jgi:hypothetical protein